MTKKNLIRNIIRSYPTNNANRLGRPHLCFLGYPVVRFRLFRPTHSIPRFGKLVCFYDRNRLSKNVIIGDWNEFKEGECCNCGATRIKIRV